MSDIPPPIGEQGPPPEVPAAPRRGIRAGKVAQRKRKAYIKFRLESEPDLTEDQIYIIHADKSQRPLYFTRVDSRSAGGGRSTADSGGGFVVFCGSKVVFG